MKNFSDMQDKDFDYYFKLKLQQNLALKPDEQQWDELSQLLDLALPVAKEPRRRLVWWWWLGGIAVVGTIGYLLYQLHIQQQTIIALRRNHSQQPVAAVVATPTQETQAPAQVAPPPSVATAAFAAAAPATISRRTVGLQLPALALQSEPIRTFTAPALMPIAVLESVLPDRTIPPVLFNEGERLASFFPVNDHHYEPMYDSAAIANLLLSGSNDKRQSISEKTLEFLTPDYITVGVIAGKGVSPQQFENEPDALLEGTENYGIRATAHLNNHFFVAGKLEYLRQSLAYFQDDKEGIKFPHLATAEGYYVDYAIAQQQYAQASIGVNYLINPSKKFNAYLGVGLPVQRQLGQQFVLHVKNDETYDEYTETFAISPRTDLIMNTVALNGGVGYQLTERLSLHLEGNYHAKIPSQYSFVPDLFNLNVAMAYNL